MLNQFTIAGRLTSTPEQKVFPSGTKVTVFTVANESDYKPKDGSDKPVNFISMECYGQPGEFINSYCSKGDLIVCTGKISLKPYKAKDGANRVSHNYIVSQVYLMNKVGNTTGQYKNTDSVQIEPTGQVKFPGGGTYPAYGVEEVKGDDLPF